MKKIIFLLCFTLLTVAGVGVSYGNTDEIKKAGIEKVEVAKADFAVETIASVEVVAPVCDAPSFEGVLFSHSTNNDSESEGPTLREPDKLATRKPIFNFALKNYRYDNYRPWFAANSINYKSKHSFVYLRSPHNWKC